MGVEERILYEDKEILVYRKPAGLAVQCARVGTPDLESGLRNYLALKNHENSPYIGVVHRLDQPVEGLLVFAKTSASAADLAKQMTKGCMVKEYLAVTRGKPPKEQDVLVDYLKKDGRRNSSVSVSRGTPGAKRAELSYHVLGVRQSSGGEEKYLLKICLKTGRHHQIRVQLSGRGMPLLGDRKYNPAEKESVPLGLCAFRLTFFHPVGGEKMCFETFPEGEAFRDFREDEL
ncbi:MAG: RluA family pseudouridine synthase [Clostridiales bacterium]|nr:RluA family pseudouridine synthase [Clostridiales bacterium]